MITALRIVQKGKKHKFSKMKRKIQADVSCLIMNYIVKREKPYLMYPGIVTRIVSQPLLSPKL